MYFFPIKYANKKVQSLIIYLPIKPLLSNITIGSLNLFNLAKWVYYNVVIFIISIRFNTL